MVIILRLIIIIMVETIEFCMIDGSYNVAVLYRYTMNSQYGYLRSYSVMHL